jgi:hypothetical protein
MSRAAQRLELRTVNDMIYIAGVAILRAAMKLLVEKDGHRAYLDAPPAGWRVPFGPDANMIVVLKKHETLPMLVAATVFERGDETGKSEAGKFPGSGFR